MLNVMRIHDQSSARREEPAGDGIGRLNQSAGEPESREGPDPESGAEQFSQFVATRSTSLMRTAYLLTGDYARAEDLLQSALIRVHRHWRRVHKRGEPEAYVRKIMVNLNTDWWRRRSAFEHVVDAIPDEESRQPAADAFAAYELHDELWDALRRLPPKMRAALVLRYFEDLTEAQTAHLLDCSIGTVKSQCSRGLERLRAVYGLASRPAPDTSEPEHRSGAARSNARRSS
jgi:RNA polymerase sigma-70 factor (sigma-E family)